MLERWRIPRASSWLLLALVVVGRAADLTKMSTGGKGISWRMKTFKESVKSFWTLLGNHNALILKI